MARIYVGGINGSGKSSVGRIIAENNRGIMAVSSSDLLLNYLGLTSREELRNMTEERLQEARERALPDYLRTHNDVIIDGHFNLTEDLTSLIDGFVFIEIPAERAKEFREKETILRPDRKIDISSIKEEISRYEQKVREQEIKWGIKVKRIENNGSLSDLARVVADYYNEILESKEGNEIQRGERRV